MEKRRSEKDAVEKSRGVFPGNPKAKIKKQGAPAATELRKDSSEAFSPVPSLSNLPTSNDPTDEYYNVSITPQGNRFLTRDKTGGGSGGSSSISVVGSDITLSGQTGSDITNAELSRPIQANGKIKNLSNPTNSSDAVNLSTLEDKIENNTAQTLTGAITGNLIGAEIETSLEPLISDLDANGKRIINVPTPEAANTSDAANVQFVLDNAGGGGGTGAQSISGAVTGALEEGSTDIPTTLNALSDNLSAGDHRITDLQNPEDDQDAATKSYVDDQTGTSFEYLQLFSETDEPRDIETGDSINFSSWIEKKSHATNEAIQHQPNSSTILIKKPGTYHFKAFLNIGYENESDSYKIINVSYQWKRGTSDFVGTLGTARYRKRKDSGNKYYQEDGQSPAESYVTVTQDDLDSQDSPEVRFQLIIQQRSGAENVYFKGCQVAVSTASSIPQSSSGGGGGTGAQSVSGAVVGSISGTNIATTLEPLVENLNANSQKITDLSTPTNPQDAATKQYVDFYNIYYIRDTSSSFKSISTNSPIPFTINEYDELNSYSTLVPYIIPKEENSEVKEWELLEGTYKIQLHMAIYDDESCNFEAIIQQQVTVGAVWEDISSKSKNYSHENSGSVSSIPAYGIITVPKNSGNFKIRLLCKTNEDNSTWGNGTLLTIKRLGDVNS